MLRDKTKKGEKKWGEAAALLCKQSAPIWPTLVLLERRPMQVSHAIWHGSVPGLVPIGNGSRGGQEEGSAKLTTEMPRANGKTCLALVQQQLAD